MTTKPFLGSRLATSPRQALQVGQDRPRWRADPAVPGGQHEQDEALLHL